MDRNVGRSVFLSGLAVGLVLYTTDVDAAETVGTGLQSLISSADSSMTNEILRPASKVCAGGGSLMGAYRSFVSASVTPLFLWGAAGAFISFVPNILDTLF